MWSAAGWNGSRKPFNQAEEAKRDAVRGDGIWVRAGIEVNAKPKPTTLAEAVLEAAQADLKVAQTAVIVGIDLKAATVIGQERALGEGVECRGGHDQREALRLVDMVFLHGVDSWSNRYSMEIRLCPPA